MRDASGAPRGRLGALLLVQVVLATLVALDAAGYVVMRARYAMDAIAPYPLTMLFLDGPAMKAWAIAAYPLALADRAVTGRGFCAGLVDEHDPRAAPRPWLLPTLAPR